MDWLYNVYLAIGAPDQEFTNLREVYMTDQQLVIDAVSRLPDANPMEAIR